MIPVRGVEGRRIAVLGLGRSGLSAARALRAGGAEVLAWDDGAAARERAEAEGFAGPIAFDGDDLDREDIEAKGFERDAVDILSRQHCLFLFGPYGSGKTLLTKLLQQFSSGYLSSLISLKEN